MKKNISTACYEDIVSLKYKRYLFGIEKNFDYWQAYFWFTENWKLCYYFIAVYLVAIICGKHLMKTRDPFQVHGSQLIWNIFLASFNTIIWYRVIPELKYTVQVHNFNFSVCQTGSVQHKQALAIWGWLFAMSKVLQLGDTAFIVLQKKPVKFWHWFHHAATLYLVWSISVFPSGLHKYFMAINVFAQSFMYSKYAMKSLNIRIPKTFKIGIVMVQSFQTFVMVFLTGYSYFAKALNNKCCIFDQSLRIAALVCASYLVFSISFLIKTSLKRMFNTKEAVKKIQ